MSTRLSEAFALVDREIELKNNGWLPHGPPYIAGHCLNQDFMLEFSIFDHVRQLEIKVKQMIKEDPMTTFSEDKATMYLEESPISTGTVASDPYRELLREELTLWRRVACGLAFFVGYLVLKLIER